MNIADAQRDVRMTFLGGFVGQIVSGLLWLTSASMATWGDPRQAVLVLALGGALIFPLALLGLKLMGRSGALMPGNPMGQLASQVAFTIPLALPVVGAAMTARIEWFYPAMMVIVGAHYLPFVFLYGLPMFGVLGGLMVAGGVMLGLRNESFELGGWITGALLLVFAFVGRTLVARESTATRP